MVHTDRLVALIKASGFKKGYVASTLGLTCQGLTNKLTGARAFKVEEAQALAQLLSLSPEQRDEIFFAPEGDF